jgi:hypothetical protein
MFFFYFGPSMFTKKKKFYDFVTRCRLTYTISFAGSMITILWISWVRSSPNKLAFVIGQHFQPSIIIVCNPFHSCKNLKI